MNYLFSSVHSLSCVQLFETPLTAACQASMSITNEAQAGIKIAGRNINNLRYADDSALMAESEELLKKVKEESEKGGLKLNIQKTKTMVSHHFMANRWGNNGNGETLFGVGLGGAALKSTQMVTAAMKLKDSCSLEEKLWLT